VEVKTDEKSGKKLMKLKEEKAPQKGVIMKLPIKDRQDLQIVCSRATGATFAVPEIGFSAGAEEKTVIDTIYNHIGQAIFKLEFLATEAAEPQRRKAITDTTEELRKCLDCDREWTFVLRDPSGQSEIKKEGVDTQSF
jgi:C4-type Zn-finger protein